MIVVADRFAQLAPLASLLRRQTARERVELVVAAPSAAAFGLDESEVEGLAGTSIVETGSLDLTQARRAALAAARGPFVFLGETHIFPEPGWAQALIGAHERGWDVVAPTIGNANPDGALSSAGLLLHYGPWTAPARAREVRAVSIYLTSYRRSLLLGHPDVLLEPGGGLSATLRGEGCRFYLAAEAAMAHANVSLPGAWIVERLAAGRVYAGGRALAWPRRRRALYTVAAPLIPAVHLTRLLRATGLRRFLRLPVLTLPAMAIGAILMAIGEAAGYALGPGSALGRMRELELNRFDYVRTRPWEQPATPA